MMNPFLQVALGGALGSVARHGVNLATMRTLGRGFPAGTMAVNVAGSFLMGVLFILLAHRGQPWAPLLMTGVLGGFTTFSAFSLDTLTLWQAGRHGIAAAYVAASVGLSLAAIAAGLALGRGVTG